MDHPSLQERLSNSPNQSSAPNDATNISRTPELYVQDVSKCSDNSMFQLGALIQPSPTNKRSRESSGDSAERKVNSEYLFQHEDEEGVCSEYLTTNGAEIGPRNSTPSVGPSTMSPNFTASLDFQARTGTQWTDSSREQPVEHSEPEPVNSAENCNSAFDLDAFITAKSGQETGETQSNAQHETRGDGNDGEAGDLTGSEELDLESSGEDVTEGENEHELVDIPVDLRTRSPNVAHLLQRKNSASKSPAGLSPLVFTPTPSDRATTSNTTVGVFINGKLSGHSEQRSVLTSHYLAINSLGVLSQFHYRLRVTELPDSVCALANGEIVVADNHSDIQRLKFFDCNQRYQRSLPIKDDKHSAHSSPAYVTDIQLSNQDAHLWICDSFNQTVREMDLASGETLQLWTNERLQRGEQLIRPGKLAIAPDRVFVSDAGDETVKCFRRSNGDFLFKFTVGVNDSHADHSNDVTTNESIHSTDDCGCPWAVHWTLDETLLIGDIRYDLVYIVDNRGKRLGKFGGSGKAANKFNGPVAICSDGDGNIAIADAKNGRVQMFTRDMMSITQVYPVQDDEEVSAIALTADGMMAVLDHVGNQCLIF